MPASRDRRNWNRPAAARKRRLPDGSGKYVVPATRGTVSAATRRRRRRKYRRKSIRHHGVTMRSSLFAHRGRRDVCRSIVETLTHAFRHQRLHRLTRHQHAAARLPQRPFDAGRGYLWKSILQFAHRETAHVPRRLSPASAGSDACRHRPCPSATAFRSDGKSAVLTRSPSAFHNSSERIDQRVYNSSGP